jgi:hypothetical protein
MTYARLCIAILAIPAYRVHPALPWIAMALSDIIAARGDKPHVS